MIFKKYIYYLFIVIWLAATSWTQLVYWCEVERQSTQDTIESAKTVKLVEVLSYQKKTSYNKNEKPITEILTYDINVITVLKWDNHLWKTQKSESFSIAELSCSKYPLQIWEYYFVLDDKYYTGDISNTFSLSSWNKSFEIQKNPWYEKIYKIIILLLWITIVLLSYKILWKK